MRFIHSADWQLGAGFARFGEQSSTLREARFSTLERALRLAEDRSARVFLVAGDLFEDNHVADSLVSRALELFAGHPSLKIWLLPGNHDPDSGPDAVWRRAVFRRKPDNVRVFLDPVHFSEDGVSWMVSPLKQKVSSIDPSLRFVEMASEAQAGAPKVGITHGSPAVPGKYQPNDFPIALDAASRAGLDYLAIGHWHNWGEYDSGRMIMPGTPEPDQFDQDGTGCVAMVEVGSAGSKLLIERTPVATLNWRALAFDVTEDVGPEEIVREINAVAPDRSRAVARVTLTGSTDPVRLREIEEAIRAALGNFAAAQLSSNASGRLAPADLERLKLRHPMLVNALGALDRAESLLTGQPLAEDGGAFEDSPIAVLEEIMASVKLGFGDITPEIVRTARSLMIQAMTEGGDDT